MKVTANYDADNKVSTLSGKHSKPSRKKDIERLIKELKDYSVFTYQEGRTHVHFKKHRQNVMKILILQNIRAGWMKKKLESLLLYNY